VFDLHRFVLYVIQFIVRLFLRNFLNIVLIILFVGQFFIFIKYLRNKLFFIFSSLAIDLRNARERSEAYKVIRRLLHLYPLQIPHSLVYVLDSIVSSSYLTALTRPVNPSVVPDQMIKCCLELLCEIGKKKSFFLYLNNESLCL
jgi:hypothetical protein